MAHSGAGVTRAGSDPAEAARPDWVDFAVGLVTRNQSETIGPLLRSVADALAAAFAGRRVVVIHADGGSQDGTVERAREALGGREGDLSQVRFESDGPGFPAGSGWLDPAALRCLFAEARRLGAPGCAVLDARVRQIPSFWIERLARPILAGEVDFVAPYYRRHPLDGTITSAIAYPFQRALYGKQIRFPLVRDFACSGRLLGALLEGPDAEWPAELARVGADVWLITRVLTGDYRIGQCFLGVPPVPASEGAPVAEVLPRVLGALFLEAERRAAFWQKVRRSVPVPIAGTPRAETPKPRVVEVGRALEAFRLGERNLQEVWRLILPPGARLELARLARRPEATFRFPDPLWARLVYDFALAHRLRVMNREHLLAAFVPLYLGWLAGFALELGPADPVRAEQRLEELGQRFEVEKPYLMARWRWPDRFNP